MFGWLLAAEWLRESDVRRDRRAREKARRKQEPITDMDEAFIVSYIVVAVVLGVPMLAIVILAPSLLLGLLLGWMCATPLIGTALALWLVRL